MWRQRVRWSRGHLLVYFQKTKELLKSLFSFKKKNKVSTYDILINIMPFCLVLTTIGILQFIMLLFSPLFGISLGPVLIEWLKRFAFASLVTYATGLISAIVIFILERKRIKNVSFFKKVIMTFAWPLFLLLQFPIDVVAVFNKNCGWKTIPHDDTTDFETLNETGGSEVVVLKTNADNSENNSDSTTVVNE